LDRGASGPDRSAVDTSECRTHVASSAYPKARGLVLCFDERVRSRRCSATLGTTLHECPCAKRERGVPCRTTGPACARLSPAVTASCLFLYPLGGMTLKRSSCGLSYTTGRVSTLLLHGPATKASTRIEAAGKDGEIGRTKPAPSAETRLASFEEGSSKTALRAIGRQSRAREQTRF